uniref:Uncharacterized protein n=1 Tax=Rhizophora mucronata TaxID=61149 RepID=A0A2P2QLR3_RHIMU
MFTYLHFAIMWIGCMLMYFISSFCSKSYRLAWKQDFSC